MFKISDRVKETTVTTGTGPIILTGALVSFQSFNDAIGDGNTTYYAIENNARWEVGQGTYNQGSNSLSRDVVFASSNNGGKIVLEGNSIVFGTLPAKKAFILDPDNNVSASGFIGSSGVFNTLNVGDIFVSGTATFDEDVFFNNIFVTGEILNSGFLTLVRPDSAGNFFHAYKDDGTRRTVSLYVDGNAAPQWRLGIKPNPNDQDESPQYGYVFGRDGLAGFVADASNYLSLSNSNGLLVTHNDSLVFRTSESNNTSIEGFNSSEPTLTVTAPILANQDIQRWNNSSDFTLTVVDSGGKIGILTNTPDYELDVNGSGRMDTITLTSGIYFPDGTFQSSASAGGGGGAATFPNDLTVSLGGGKTFGRYEDGDVIPASGLTAPDVITLAVTEPIDPTVNLSSSSSVDFNQTNVSVTLSFSHTINSLGASVASASLEFRRANTGAWTVLSTSTTTPDSFVHNFTDSAFNTDQLNYRYTVTDSVGATATATFNINPDTYSAPSISFNVDAVSLTGPESDLSRERGNDESDLINGNVSRNEAYVDIQTAQWQYRANGGAWQDIDASINLPAAGGSLSTKNHLPSETTASTIQYRIEVVDDYQTTYSSTITVNFGLLIFYGPSSSVPVTSANVRALPDRLFTNGNDTFNLNTGSTEVNFTVAIPDTETISEVLDLDALNANITSEYVNNPFNVDDGGGTAVAYNVYTMTIAIPYSSNHRHQVTKG